MKVLMSVRVQHFSHNFSCMESDPNLEYESTKLLNTDLFWIHNNVSTAKDNNHNQSINPID